LALSDKLEEWGLSELGFGMELVLSELITNAIRYGSEPIHVRLIRDRTLTCEVSDGSSTSPHLRYAATTDEGGRGLFLVSQMTERWGTRYTPQGKVIWAEQTVPDVPGDFSLTWPDDDGDLTDASLAALTDDSLSGESSSEGSHSDGS